MLSETGVHRKNISFSVTLFTIMEDCKSSPSMPTLLIFIWETVGQFQSKDTITVELFGDLNMDLFKM